MPDDRGSGSSATTASTAAAAGEVLPSPPYPAPDARTVFGHLRQAATEFESRLRPEEEAAVQVLSFGQSVLVHQPELRCVEPSLLRLDGVDGQGRPIQVIQHVSQLSLALVAVPRRADTPARMQFRA